MFSDLICTKGTIVISGGLGGLAIEMSKWMIKEYHVKRIVLMARKTIEELEENSPQLRDWKYLHQIAQKYESFVELVKVDVTKFDQVFNAIQRINKTEYPVRGIIHTAMALHDTLIMNMTQEMLTKVMRPKIHGAWNLHHAIQITKSPIHFFIMFSSVQNHCLTEIGQSNYNAGNNFLDALAYWRFHCKKLPALSISLPVISGAGYAHKNVESAQLLRDYAVPATYMFKMIEEIHRKQQISLNITAPIVFLIKWSKVLKGKNLSKNLQHIAEEFIEIEKTEGSLIDKKTNLTNEINSTDILTKIHKAVSELFGSLSIDRVDLDKPLIQQGMDSLVAAQLHNWLGKQLHIFLSVVEILHGMSINDIAKYVYSKSLKDNISTINITIDDNISSRIEKKNENESYNNNNNNNNEIDIIDNESSLNNMDSDEVLYTENLSTNIHQYLKLSQRTSLAQERIYLHERIYFDQENSTAIYNVPFLLKIIHGTISVKKLRIALFKLIKKNLVLRTGIKYSMEDEYLKQYIKPMNEYIDDNNYIIDNHQEYYSFQMSNISKQQELEQILINERKTKYFDIESGLVLRCHIIFHESSKRTIDNDNLILSVNDYIIFNIHHIGKLLLQH
ncbi:unnamed protein product [Rotaria sp. Silwood1]|nr:unnamed protein product [Rotaria sp. Silwood1]CAF1470381.1 unnamed protein product [Rotaria sp. Silwood1]CAF3643068.1 unnamed protein product [Rotaria sp. Silwood1]CAF5006514.1 unnamed protein product [Rotaria sp. Silwood1]